MWWVRLVGCPTYCGVAAPVGGRDVGIPWGVCGHVFRVREILRKLLPAAREPRCAGCARGHADCPSPTGWTGPPEREWIEDIGSRMSYAYRQARPSMGFSSCAVIVNSKPSESARKTAVVAEERVRIPGTG